MYNENKYDTMWYKIQLVQYDTMDHMNNNKIQQTIRYNIQYATICYNKQWNTMYNDDKYDTI